MCVCLFLYICPFFSEEKNIFMKEYELLFFFTFPVLRAEAPERPLPSHPCHSATFSAASGCRCVSVATFLSLLSPLCRCCCHFFVVAVATFLSLLSPLICRCCHFSLLLSLFCRFCCQFFVVVATSVSLCRHFCIVFVAKNIRLLHQTQKDL